MTSRGSFRLETRSRARDDIRRIVQAVDKVRKWEKKWVDLGLSNSLKVYKWVPIREEVKDEEEASNKENEPMEVTSEPSSSVTLEPSLVPQNSVISSMLTHDPTPTASLPQNILDEDVGDSNTTVSPISSGGGGTAAIARLVTGSSSSADTSTVENGSVGAIQQQQPDVEPDTNSTTAHDESHQDN